MTDQPDHEAIAKLMTDRPEQYPNQGNGTGELVGLICVIITSWVIAIAMFYGVIKLIARTLNALADNGIGNDTTISVAFLIGWATVTGYNATRATKTQAKHHK